MLRQLRLLGHQSSPVQATHRHRKPGLPGHAAGEWARLALQERHLEWGAPLPRQAEPASTSQPTGRSAADLPPEDDEAEDAPSRIPGTLRGWQRRQLQNAVKEGRKKISVKYLVGNLGIPRAEVLWWLKVLEREGAASSAPSSRPQQSLNQRPTPPGFVEWSSKRPKRLGGQARATLDKLFQHTPRLDKALLDEVCAVHRISRPEAQAYFRALQQGAQTQAVQDDSWRDSDEDW